MSATSNAAKGPSARPDRGERQLAAVSAEIGRRQHIHALVGAVVSLRRHLADGAALGVECLEITGFVGSSARPHLGHGVGCDGKRDLKHAVMANETNAL